MSQASDGLTESIEILIGGSPKGTYDIVTDVSTTPKFDTRTRKPIGSRKTVLTQDASGWDVSFTIADTDGGIDTALTAYIDNVLLRRRQPVTIMQTVFYPSTGTRLLHTYVDGVIDGAPRSCRRNEDSSFSMSLTFGTNRTTETL